MRVLVAGHVTLDRHGPALLAGGSAYYAARALRALGSAGGAESVDVRVLTAAGPDFPAEALAGIDAHVLPAAATTRFGHVRGRDGVRRQRVEGAPLPPLDPASLPAGWRDADLLHLGPVLGEVDVQGWRAAVPARFVGVQIQGLVRRVDPDGTVLPAPLEADLTGVHAVVLGDDEARDDPALAARLAREVPIVAFTHAEEGCELLHHGHATRIGVFRTVEVDPTGAGDVFAAALFLSLARGADPVEAAQLASAAASIVVEGRAGATLDRVAEAPRRSLGITIVD